MERRTAVAVGKATPVKGRVTKYHGGWHKLRGGKPLLVAVVHTFSERRFLFFCIISALKATAAYSVQWSQVTCSSVQAGRTSVPMLFLNALSHLS